MNANVFEAHILHRHQADWLMDTAAAGEPHAQACVTAINEWLERREAGSPARCLDCDAAFSAESSVEAFLIILPFKPLDGDCAVAGVCAVCAKRADLVPMVRQRIHERWPSWAMLSDGGRA